jgi:hypothetical protein
MTKPFSFKHQQTVSFLDGTLNIEHSHSAICINDNHDSHYANIFLAEAGGGDSSFLGLLTSDATPVDLEASSLDLVEWLNTPDNNV